MVTAFGHCTAPRLVLRFSHVLGQHAQVNGACSNTDWSLLPPMGLDALIRHDWTPKVSAAGVHALPESTHEIKHADEDLFPSRV